MSVDKHRRAHGRVGSVVWLVGRLAAGGLALCVSSVYGADADTSSNNFGGIGLLEMRTARFAPDGEITVGVHHNSRATRVFSTWQATPWMEATLSYTDEKSADLGVDRSLDIKLRLWQESKYRPQLAIGIQDILGNGRYASEYLVASKRYYDFDFTAGFAWGFLGSREGMGNMFRLFGDGFTGRETSASSGEFRTGSYFAGREMAFFAGLEYQTPVDGLSLKAEYSGVDRTKYAEFSHYRRKSAFNVGVNYQPTDWASLALGLDHGDRLTFRLSLKQNLHKLKFRKLFKGPKPAAIMERRRDRISDQNMPEMTPGLTEADIVFNRLKHLGVSIISLEQKPDKMVFTVRQERGEHQEDHLVLLGALLESYDRVELRMGEAGTFEASRHDDKGIRAQAAFHQTTEYKREISFKIPDEKTLQQVARIASEDLEQANLSPLSVSLTEKEVTVVKQAGPSFNEVKNIGHTARILTRDMPDTVEIFTTATEKGGLEISRVSILRRDLEKANRYEGSPEEIWAGGKISPPHAKPVEATAAYKTGYPVFDFGILPDVKTHFGGNQDGRFRRDIYLKLYAAAQVTQDIGVLIEARQYLLGDLDQIPLDDRPDVPKVRSDVAQYAKEGRTSIERLQFDYARSFNEDFYARISSGLLESMYGGVSGEFLYRPYKRNFAMGIDVNWLKQRDYDQLFSFRDYSVLTGHLTFYHENVNYNITSKLSVGRYLAGDYGATVDISRRFSNGIRLGVWATVTDMSSEKFGEGSFDKGIYLTMPLEILWYKPTTKKMRFDFRSLGKNGGQRLDRAQGLYELISEGRKARLADNWREILE